MKKDTTEIRNEILRLLERTDKPITDHEISRTLGLGYGPTRTFLFTLLANGVVKGELLERDFPLYGAYVYWIEKRNKGQSL